MSDIKLNLTPEKTPDIIRAATYAAESHEDGSFAFDILQSLADANQYRQVLDGMIAENKSDLAHDPDPEHCHLPKLSFTDVASTNQDGEQIRHVTLSAGDQNVMSATINLSRSKPGHTWISGSSMSSAGRRCDM